MNNTPACPAKVRRPNRPNVCRRQRPFDCLDRLQSNACIWVSGPPGSGKTTLIADYLERRPDETSVWYRVDDGDRDPANCFHYLGVAAASVDPDIRAGLPIYSPAFTQATVTFSSRFFEKLFAGLPEPFSLVFEDFQSVDDVSDFNTLVALAVDSLPAGCRIYMISRRPPPPEYSRLIANERMGCLTWNELRLTEQEVGEIARARGFDLLSDDDVARLASMCNGWMAGLTLLLQSDQIASGTVPVDERRPQVLFDYFAREIFSRRDRESQDFLMRAALLPVLSCPVVTELTGCKNHWQDLVELHERNYFTDFLAEPEPSYQFHALFRDFLLNQLETRYSDREIRELRLHAGKIAESARHTEAAVDLYATSRSYDELIRLLDTEAPALLRQGRAETLAGWLSMLPAQLSRDFPRLEYWRAICRLFDSPHTALGLFERAYRGCLDQDDDDGAQWAWAGAIHAILITWTEFRRLEDWVARGEALAARSPGFASPGIEISFSYAMCLAVIFSRPDDRRCERLVDETIRLMQQPQSLSQQLMTGNLLLQQLAWMGATSKARVLCETLRNRAHQVGTTDEQQLSLLAARASLGLQVADAESALDFAEQGMALSRESGVSVWRHKLIGVAIHANLLLGRNDQARAYLRVDGELLPETQNLLWWHHHWLYAWCEWQTGHPQDALERLAAGEAILEIAGWPDMPAAKYFIGMAIVTFDLGDTQRARRHLDEAARIGRRLDSRFMLHQCAMVEAVFALAEQPGACIEAGRSAMEIGRGAELMVVDWLDRDRVAEISGRLLAEDIETDHVRNLVRAHRLSAPQVAESLEAWPWPVKVYALGGFRMLIDDELVGEGTKRQKKVVDLLKALIAHGGAQVSESVLTEALWPDAEADAAHNSLKSAVHRLRQLLGRADALRIENGGFSLNPECCWVDAWEVSKLLQPSDRLGTRRIELICRGIELYAGPLFHGDDDAWILSPRDQLQERVRNAITDVGRYWERLEEWQSAIDTYERGLTVDEFAETIYRRLMVCHEQLGHHADAIITFERCRRRLDSALGVAPSRTTQALADEIRHH